MIKSKFGYTCKFAPYKRNIYIKKYKGFGSKFAFLSLDFLGRSNLPVTYEWIMHSLTCEMLFKLIL